jgi:5-methyltetrahydropteroyltriglutamate--homocysteine methyltransferase
MHIQTEPIGSIPRPIELILGIKAHAVGQLKRQGLRQLYDAAVSATIKVLKRRALRYYGRRTDKTEFRDLPLHSGPAATVSRWCCNSLADGHTRQLPKLTGGPFGIGICGFICSESKAINIFAGQAGCYLCLCNQFIISDRGLRGLFSSPIP